MKASQSSILATLREMKPMLKSRFKVRSLGLFGSYARGDENEQSDIDILVDVDPEIGLEFVTMADTVEDALGKHVDMISKSALNARALLSIEDELINV